MKVRSNGFHVLSLSNNPMIGVATHILLYNYLSDFIGEGRIFFKFKTNETKNITSSKKTIIFRQKTTKTALNIIVSHFLKKALISSSFCHFYYLKSYFRGICKYIYNYFQPFTNQIFTSW